ncbi:hypothetical protein SEVIR_9G052533v4 [Setaria viridis]
MLTRWLIRRSSARSGMRTASARRSSRRGVEWIAAALAAGTGAGQHTRSRSSAGAASRRARSEASVTSSWRRATSSRRRCTNRTGLRAPPQRRRRHQTGLSGRGSRPGSAASSGSSSMMRSVEDNMFSDENMWAQRSHASFSCRSASSGSAASASHSCSCSRRDQRHSSKEASLSARTGTLAYCRSPDPAMDCCCLLRRSQDRPQSYMTLYALGPTLDFF